MDHPDSAPSKWGFKRIASTTGFVAAFLAILTYFGLQPDYAVPEHQSAQTGAPPEAPIMSVESLNPETEIPAFTASPPMAILGINAVIDSTYAVGQNKALACPEFVNSFCLAVTPTVLSDEGQLQSQCHLSWKLFLAGGDVVLDAGRIQYCQETIYIGHTPLQPGEYVLKMSVELDDGTLGNSDYDFTLLDE